jgi:hypothetical protein
MLHLRGVSNEPLNFEEHRELGEEMQKTQTRLLQLSRMLRDVYGPNSRSTYAFEKVNEAMERLNEELRRQAIEDCPGRDADLLYRSEG